MRRQMILASSLLALATAARAQDAVLLRVGGTVGQNNRYQTVMDMFVQGGPMAQMGGDTSQPMMRMTTVTTRTLTAANGDTLTFTETIDSARTESPGMPQMAAMMANTGAMLRGQVTTTRMDGRARVFGMESNNPNMPGMGGGGPGGRGAGGMGNMGRNQRAMYMLPERPVRVGESWTDSMVTQGVGNEGPTNFLATFRLERVDTRPNARVAVVSMNGTLATSGPRGPQQLSVTGEFQLDLTNTRLVAVTMTSSGTAPMGPSGDVPIRMVLTQLLIP